MVLENVVTVIHTNMNKVQSETDMLTVDGNENDRVLKELQKIEPAIAQVSVIIDDENIDCLAINETELHNDDDFYNVFDRKFVFEVNAVNEHEMIDSTKVDDEEDSIDIDLEIKEGLLREIEQQEKFQYDLNPDNASSDRIPNFEVCSEGQIEESVELDEKLCGKAVVKLVRVDETDAFRRHFKTKPVERTVELPQNDEVVQTDKATLTAEVAPVSCDQRKRKFIKKSITTDNRRIRLVEAKRHSKRRGKNNDKKKQKERRVSEDVFSCKDPMEEWRRQKTKNDIYFTIGSYKNTLENAEKATNNSKEASINIKDEDRRCEKRKIPDALDKKQKRKRKRREHSNTHDIHKLSTKTKRRKKTSKPKEKKAKEKNTDSNRDPVKEQETQKTDVIRRLVLTVNLGNKTVKVKEEKYTRDHFEEWEAQKKYFGMDDLEDKSDEEMSAPKKALKELTLGDAKQPIKESIEETQKEQLTVNETENSEEKKEQLAEKKRKMYSLEVWEREKNKCNKYFSIGDFGKSEPKKAKSSLNAKKDNMQGINEVQLARKEGQLELEKNNTFGEGVINKLSKPVEQDVGYINHDRKESEIDRPNTETTLSRRDIKETSRPVQQNTIINHDRNDSENGRPKPKTSVSERDINKSSGLEQKHKSTHTSIHTETLSRLVDYININQIGSNMDLSISDTNVKRSRKPGACTAIEARWAATALAAESGGSSGTRRCNPSAEPRTIPGGTTRGRHTAVLPEAASLSVRAPTLAALNILNPHLPASNDARDPTPHIVYPELHGSITKPTRSKEIAQPVHNNTASDARQVNAPSVNYSKPMEAVQGTSLLKKNQMLLSLLERKQTTFGSPNEPAYFSKDSLQNLNAIPSTHERNAHSDGCSSDTPSGGRPRHENVIVAPGQSPTTPRTDTRTHLPGDATASLKPAEPPVNPVQYPEDPSLEKLQSLRSLLLQDTIVKKPAPTNAASRDAPRQSVITYTHSSYLREKTPTLYSTLIGPNSKSIDNRNKENGRIIDSNLNIDNVRRDKSMMRIDSDSSQAKMAEKRLGNLWKAPNSYLPGDLHSHTNQPTICDETIVID